MGIPGFFKWLTEKKYLNITKLCTEYEPSYDEHGTYQPLDETTPNPNNIEFDNLYIDLNGIIHICTSSDNCSRIKTVDDIIKLVFDSIDRLFSIVRPRKLLYIALDGVAPRAKLHQQRSRRFREFKDASDKAEDIQKIKTMILANGNVFPTDENPKVNMESFDENYITSGTSFMSYLSDCLRYYIYHRMNKKPAWSSIKVILSDANVPGEGEHKIINYIRAQQKHAGYNRNTQHVIYSMDADLILLGLATHENHITIIRDMFNPNQPQICDICRQFGHDFKNCKGIPKEKLSQLNVLSSSQVNSVKIKYIFVDLSKLREELLKSLPKTTDISFNWDSKRFIDDWIFICLLVGNDFLPDSPSFEIIENVIDNLINIYISYVSTFKTYLTDNGKLNLEVLERIVNRFGEKEDELFRNRRKTNQQPPSLAQPTNTPSKPLVNVAEITAARANPLPTIFKPPSYSFARTNSSIKKPAEVNTQTSEKQIINSITKISLNNHQNGDKKQETANLSAEGNRQEENIDPNDPTRLWDDGWHERYYINKFKVDKDHWKECRIQVVKNYVQGLCWVLQYYYHDVPSWDWYYPYYYAPFASDLVNLNSIVVEFSKDSEPFKPLMQLMCLFPAQCAKYLPEKWQSLVLEQNSGISHFYPLNFTIDPNGKHFRSQYTVQLPFIDDKTLLGVLEDKVSLLTSEEQQRNEYTNDLLFIHSKHTSYKFFEKVETKKENPVNITTANEIIGYVWKDNDQNKFIPIGKTVTAPISNYEPIAKNRVLCVEYRI